MPPGSAGIWDLTDKRFALFDATQSYGVFTGFSGGDMAISMIPYTVMGVNGAPIEINIPGQVSFAPITLSCELSDVVEELTEWFQFSVDGAYHKPLVRNCSIGAYAPIDPSLYIIQWDLLNVVPTTLPSFFSYNAYIGSSSIKFKLTLQAEDIKITYQRPKA